MKRSCHGFTLFELALVMLIVALLSSAALGPMQTYAQSRLRRITATHLDQAVEALYGFALIHGRLPCPDTEDSGDGQEDRRSDTSCMAREGFLPHVDLGVAGQDAWGSRLRYQLAAATTTGTAGSNFAAVDDGFCNDRDQDLDLCERGDITIRTRGDNHATAVLEAKHAFNRANQVPAVVVSHGANGYNSLLGPAAPLSNGDEIENSDGDAVFIARGYSSAQTDCADDTNEAAALCAFDDQLRWLSSNILNYRLIAAGRLP